MELQNIFTQVVQLKQEYTKMAYCKVIQKYTNANNHALANMIQNHLQTKTVDNVNSYDCRKGC